MGPVDVLIDASEPIARKAFFEYVADVFGALLSVAKLVRNGEILPIDRFRLRQKFSDGESSPEFSLLGHPAADITIDLCLKSHIEVLAQIAPPEIEPGVCAQGRWESFVDGRLLDGTFWPVADDGDFVFSYRIPNCDDSLNRTGRAASRTIAFSVAPSASVGGNLRDPIKSYFAPLVEVLLDTIDLLVHHEPVVPTHLVINGRSVALSIVPLDEPIVHGSRIEERGSCRQPLHGVASSEPAITTLARHWALLRTYVACTDMKRWIDGFRLRRAADWVVATSGHPAEMYEYLARICNVSCQFCYLHGNPPSMAIGRGRKVVSQSELDTRMRYFSPAKRSSLFHAQWELNEFLVDPKLSSLLPQLRLLSDEPFYFVTNGNPLSERICDLLATVMPVHIIVSVNTIDADVRAAVMQERRSRTEFALRSLKLLAERRIPFAISLAAFPDFSIDSLERTIEAASPLGPVFVRVNLPGFTDQLPYQNDFNVEKHWYSVVEWARKYRTRCKIPIMTIPSAFEEDRFHTDPSAPRIIGTVLGSPASQAGLQAGDIIRRVGFMEISSRSELLSVLLLQQGRIDLEVDREGISFSVVLDTRRQSFHPYIGNTFGKYIMPWGILSAPSLSAESIRQIREHIDATQAEHAWIVSSPLMVRAARKMIDAELPNLAAKIDLIVATNRFLGGNIQVMDMCTIGDIGHAVESQLSVTKAPDLILLPGSGFNMQGRDITGRHWGDLERRLRIPTRLLDIAQFRF